MARLGEICKFQSGGTPAKSDSSFYGGNIPWITTVALNGSLINDDDAVDWITEKAINNSAAKIVPENSVMVGTRVGVGKVARNCIPMSTSQDIISLIGIDENIWDKDYICKFIGSKNDYLNSQARGATIKGIKIEILDKLEVPNLGIAQQKRVSSIIDKVNTLISLRQQQLEKLDQLVKSRFIEMFGMPGEDTKGWGFTRLGDCCELNPKKGNESRLKKDLMVSFVPMQAVSENGSMDASNTKSFDDVKMGFTYFADGDVIFAKITPCMENGKGAVAKGLKNGIGFGSTEFHILRPIGGISNPYWICAVTSFEQFRHDAAANMTGSAGQRRVPASYLNNYKISLPPISLQNHFAAFVSQVDKSKFEIQQSLEKLEILKKALMQKYFG